MDLSMWHVQKTCTCSQTGAVSVSVLWSARNVNCCHYIIMCRVYFLIPVYLTVLCKLHRLPCRTGKDRMVIDGKFINIKKEGISLLYEVIMWSSGQSSWLQIQSSRFDSRGYQIFWEVVGLKRGPLSLVSTTEELPERKSSGSALENRDYGRRGSAALTTRHPSIRISWH
jgi:hypothetical protein